MSQKFVINKYPPFFLPPIIADNANRPFSILQKTILDLINISESERDLTCRSFDRLRFADLTIEANEWDRLHRYAIYPEDFLTNILNFSLEYIYGIWQEEAHFIGVMDNVFRLIETSVGHDNPLQLMNICTGEKLFENIDFSVLDGIVISPSIVPEKMVNQLLRHEIKEWKDLSDITECEIVKRSGENTKSLSLLCCLNSLYPFVIRMSKYMHVPIAQKESWSSYDSLISAWVLRRTGNEKYTDMLMRRMGWGLDEPETLESIARAKRLTRERVRQIEVKLRLSLRHPNSIKELYPLWIAIDSFLQESGGTCYVDELSEALQRYYKWKEKPSSSGLKNLLYFCPAGILDKNSYIGNGEFIYSQNFFCSGCAEVSSHVLEIVSKAKKLGIMDVIDQVNTFCKNQCEKGHKYYFKFKRSFIDYIIRDNELLRKSVKSDENNLYHIDTWNALHGRLISAIESILKSNRRAMHFTEIYSEIAKTRADIYDVSFSEHNVHATLDRMPNVFLWDRGKFIHRNHVQIPHILLGKIEKWIITKLEKGLPFISINGVFNHFKDHCVAVGIPAESALYTCLRVNKNDKLSYPRYPQIILSNKEDQKTPYSVLIDEYFKEAGGAISFKQLKEYFLNEIGLKQFQLNQLISNNASIIKISSAEFIHISNLKYNSKASKKDFDELVEYSAKVASKEGHVSISKIFKDRIVQCKQIGIDSPEMLYSLFQLYASERLHVVRYPQVRQAGKDESREQYIALDIVNYLKNKKSFCAISELEEHFVNKLGYGLQTIWSIRYREDIYTYLRGSVVHRDVINWSPDKQNTLEKIATSVYNEFAMKNYFYGLIDQIIESDELPPLGNGVLYTNHLLADLIARNKQFILLGNANNAYVPTTNAHSIKTLEDLVGLMLSRNYNGATNLRELEEMFVMNGVIQKRLTSIMLDKSEKVTIVGQEIMLTELVHNA
jgi:hypothetical protein